MYKLNYLFVALLAIVVYTGCKGSEKKKKIDDLMQVKKVLDENIILTDHIKLHKLARRKNNQIVTLSEVIKICGKPIEVKLGDSGNCRLIYLSRDSRGKLHRTNFIFSGKTIVDIVGFDRPSWDEDSK